VSYSSSSRVTLKIIRLLKLLFDQNLIVIYHKLNCNFKKHINFFYNYLKPTVSTNLDKSLLKIKNKIKSKIGKAELRPNKTRTHFVDEESETSRERGQA
jgi:hypothetical protein